jgi:hypothetical protein
MRSEVSAERMVEHAFDRPLKKSRSRSLVGLKASSG